MIQDVKKCYNCKNCSNFDMEIIESHGKICEKSMLREEFKIVKKKGLTHLLDFCNIFKTKWIRIVLSRNHDSLVWLDNGPIKITKRKIHMVIRYPTLDHPKKLLKRTQELCGIREK